MSGLFGFQNVIQQDYTVLALLLGATALMLAGSLRRGLFDAALRTISIMIVALLALPVEVAVWDGGQFNLYAVMALSDTRLAWFTNEAAWIVGLVLLGISVSVLRFRSLIADRQ